MQVAFSVGKKSQGIINTLKKTADNVEFYSYGSIQEMIKDSKLRHLGFKRIVFTTSLLVNPESDLQELNEFIKNDSASSEIVMITNPNANNGEAEVFNSIFNSPMYTPVVFDRITPNILLEVVLSDVLELKMKYYGSVETSQEKVVLGASEHGSSEKPKEKELSDRKQGIFGGIFGTKKTQVEDQSQNSDLVKDVENTGDLEGNSSLEDSSVTGVEGTVSSGLDAWGVEGSESGIDSNSSFTDSGSFMVGGEDLNMDDDILSIGDFGSQHSDTGFLDDEGIEELEEISRYQNGKSMVSDSTKEEPIEETQQEVKETCPRAKITALSGCNGVGVTQMVVDKASALSNKGYKVLIVDVDHRLNGLLSYIDAIAYYSRNCEGGISKKRIYTEDGIGVVSNGYSYGLTSQDLYSFLTSYIASEYDYILVDCPVDCLDVMSEDVLNLVKLTLVVSGERSALLGTSMCLTNRDYVSLTTEKYIMNNCSVKVVNKTEYTDEDLQYVKDICLFPNGSWLEKIS